MKTIEITITGVTPLLMNKFTDAAQQKATGGTTVSLVGDRGTPYEQAEAVIYTDEDGCIGIPQPNLFRSILDAGKYFKAGRSKVTTQKSSLIPACLTIHEVFIPLQGEMDVDTRKLLWSVDTRPVRIPSTGGRILRHRPIFHEWEISFTVELDTEIISEKLLREIVDAAGKRIGLGDYRPDCKGPFGKYVVTRWAVVEAEEGADIAAVA